MDLTSGGDNVSIFLVMNLYRELTYCGEELGAFVLTFVVDDVVTLC